MWFGIAQFIQDAVVAALADNAFSKMVRKTFWRRRDALAESLAGSSLHFARPQGGMFLMLDVAATGMDGSTFAERLLDNESVAVVPGFGFGETMSTFVRVGFLAKPETLVEAGRRISHFASECVSTRHKSAERNGACNR